MKPGTKVNSILPRPCCLPLRFQRPCSPLQKNLYTAEPFFNLLTFLSGLKAAERMGDKESNVSSLRIPVIDISDADAEDTADQLVDAVARYGFAFVRGEGIGFTKPVLDNAFELVKPERFRPASTDDANITWIVAYILLLIHQRERKMRYPSQRKCSSTCNFLVTEPVSHIVLEHWMVINALRNVGPKESKGSSLLQMYKPC